VPPADKRQRKKENARAAREAREAELKKRKRNRTIRNGAIAAAVFVIAFGLLTLLTRKDKKKVVASPTTSSTSTTIAAKLPLSGVTATIKGTQGTIVLSLDTKDDPKGAGRFVALANAGVFNGSSWSRIVKDFVIQGGAPGGDATKSEGNAVVGEVPKDHYPVGSVAAAKGDTEAAGTFDSQFFIVTGAAQGASLPNDYARFGSVKSGMDVVKKIAALAVNSTDAPTTKATIDTVTISGT
jgi:peptidyl-prolyl cis-trans isomerase B (cyclophilin B)